MSGSFDFQTAVAIVAAPQLDHRPVHDPWMTDATDRDYLEPAERWCIVCARPDREHICTTCTRRADDRYENTAAGERCADKVHEPFYPASPQAPLSDSEIDRMNIRSSRGGLGRCSICHGAGEHTLSCPTRWYR